MTPIMQMGKEQLIDSVIDSFDLPALEQIKQHALITTRADELGILPQVKRMISQYTKQDKALEAEYNRAIAAERGEIELEREKNGAPKITINNFAAIMEHDPHYKNIRFNILANRAEIQEGASVRGWTDTDNAASKAYIENAYGLHHEGKHNDAIRLLFRSREYHPIQDIVDTLEWDGEERIANALHKWLKADDTPYVREVSRLIFAGGIHRLYEPGCKVDDVAVLIGTKQGEGKSSFIRWLAINDSFFSEVTTIEGREGIEQIEGAWICEMSELLALTRAKDQEAVKSYITRQRDKYRKSYDREVSDLPRRCVFVATTNNETFLRDKTGNRRFYPVKTASDGYWLHDHEQKCRDYIVQCWAEARVKYLRGDMPCVADPALLESYREARDNAMEDDWRVGAIQAYLDDLPKGARVCVRQIVHEALCVDKERPRDPTKSESNEISQIMAGMSGWVKQPKAARLPRYGLQRYWIRVEETDPGLANLPFGGVTNSSDVGSIFDDLDDGPLPF